MVRINFSVEIMNNLNQIHDTIADLTTVLLKLQLFC